MKLVVIAVLAALVDSRTYDFLAEKAELLFYNKTYVENVDFHFGKVNRTYRAVNVSFDISRDINVKLFGTLKAYQFYHNEYRYTGTQVTADTCKIERANIFSLKQQFQDAQFNISLCNIKKGSYKMVNFAPNAKYFPSYLPPGKIRSNIRVHDGQSMDLFTLNWDFEVKPIRRD